MPDPLPCDVLVVGGGHAGLMLGAALAKAGFAIRLVERQPLASIEAAAPDGRSLALLAGSVRIAQRLGVWPAIAAYTAPIEQVEVVDVEGGGRVHYDCASHGKGPFGVGVEHGNLRRGLLAAFLAHAGPEAWLQGEVAALHRAGHAIETQLADGRRVTAALVVGADGRGSRVRELARIGADRWAYGQHALTFVLRHERPHRGAVHEWLRRGGPLATLPLPGNRTGITWVERSEDAQELAGLDHAALLAEFTERSGGVLGRVEIESGPSAYPLGAQHAHHYVAPRLALVGDAAHGVHPIHAQGFNMGVADIGALADALIAARDRRLDLGSGEALLPYARVRRADNTQRLWLTDSLIRVFTNELPPLRAARSLALNAIERVTPLKRFAVRHGMQTG
jgi:2-octaprenyl-6-methoxyphenol hydroxylase